MTMLTARARTVRISPGFLYRVMALIRSLTPTSPKARGQRAMERWETEQRTRASE